MIKTFLRAAWLMLGWIELAAFTLLMFLLSYLPTGWRGNWYRRWFQIWCRTWVHALGVELRLHHKNLQPLPERFILVANHPSSFEDIGIPALFDVDCLAKQEVGDWFMVGRISAAAGTIFVRRESAESRRLAADTIAARLAAGRNIALYPEGGIKGPRLQESFRYGAFSIALQTGIPIVPVYLHYEAQHDFHWGRHSLIDNIRNIMGAANSRANYYLFDAVDPADFDDKVSYSNYLHRQYEAWQTRFLD
jgi:1-acyl-sn-glycerol-3-phosphate acyltransferase